MNEKYPHPQHNSGEEPPDNQPRPPQDEPETGAAATAEADSDAEWRLRWDVGEALLRAVYDIVEHPGDDAREAAAVLSLGLVQLTHRFDLSSLENKHALASLANTVSDQIFDLAGAYDELTTSDLQGSVGALAFQLVRNQLIVGSAELQDHEGGDHE